MNLRGQIHIHLIQKTFNAVKHTVNLMEASLLCSLVYTCKAGIDHSSRASRLSYDNIAFFPITKSPFLFMDRQPYRRRGTFNRPGCLPRVLIVL